MPTKDELITITEPLNPKFFRPVMEKDVSGKRDGVENVGVAGSDTYERSEKIEPADSQFNQNF